MSNPVEDELTKMKKERIAKLEKINARLPDGAYREMIRDKIKYFKEDLSLPILESNVGNQFSVYNIINNWSNFKWIFPPSLEGIKFFPTSVPELEQPHREFNLSRYRIQTLGSVELPQVDTLNLSNNNIIHLQGVTFPPCNRLNLSYNLISSLHGCVFPGDWRERSCLTYLDLRFNRITNFEDLNVKALPMSLKEIFLDGNPITDGMTGGEREALQRKVLYKIAKQRVHPAPSAPPPDVDEVLSIGGRPTQLKPKRKITHNLKKMNKKRKSKKYKINK